MSMSNQGSAKTAKIVLSYELQRDCFLRKRLRIALWISIAFALSITLYLLGQTIFAPNEFKLANLYIGATVELGLLACLSLQGTPLGRRYPGLLFLGFSWSLTLMVQIGAALAGEARPQTSIWYLTFLTQATLMPVRWPLHVISQMGVIACYISINALLNLKVAKATMFDFIGFYLLLFWFCFICNLSVYLYEKLQREEFNTRKSLAKAYQKLEAAEAKYRSIFENAGKGIFQSTPDGRYITANPALARIYGYAQPEEVTTNFTDIKHQLYIDPNRRAEFIRLIEEFGRVSDFESQIYRKDGSIVWISENALAVRDETGKVLYYEGLIEDITERKQAEEALRVFIHALSHDLRNPVSGTLMLLKNWANKSGGSIEIPRAILERMIRGSEQQLKLINSLLEVHASEVRGLVLHPTPVKLQDVLEAAIADLQPLLEQNQANLKNFVPETLPQICADSTQLWRVFSNLIANALKHNPPRLNLIVMATIVKPSDLNEQIQEAMRRQEHHLNPSVSLTTSSEEKPMLCCLIEDDGVGISPEQCEHLFDLYARGVQSRHSLGLGLGLYLCKQIIKEHGGEIGVISQVGAGATFWFTLPIVDCE